MEHLPGGRLWAETGVVARYRHLPRTLPHPAPYREPIDQEPRRAKILPDEAIGRLATTIDQYANSGGLDLRDTTILTTDLANLANERGEHPEYLAHLLHCPEAHTGMPGRPLLSERPDKR
jgi:hypothetical protein